MMRIAQPRMHRRPVLGGVGFIWFALLAMPALMLSLALSLDFARIIIVNHEMRNVADASAVAGAWETRPGTAFLDEPSARQAAESTACVAMRHLANQITSDRPDKSPTPWCADQAITMETTFDDEVEAAALGGTGTTRVDVTIWYSIDDLVFPAYFGAGRQAQLEVSKSAVVCIPTEVSYTDVDGQCRRPTG